ncbi:hypothetical protein IWX48DRAFT_610091 [Phyllosticta citricarpa]
MLIPTVQSIASLSHFAFDPRNGSQHRAIMNSELNYLRPTSHLILAGSHVQATSSATEASSIESTLSSEAIIGIIGLLLMIFVPFFGFLLRNHILRLLGKWAKSNRPSSDEDPEAVPMLPMSISQQENQHTHVPTPSRVEFLVLMSLSGLSNTRSRPFSA